MRDVETVVDNLTIAHLDDEWALPCEFSFHEGAEPAEWVLWPSCCTVNGAPYILGCTSCKDRQTGPEHVIGCTDCGAIFHPATLAWSLIEPLNKGA